MPEWHFIRNKATVVTDELPAFGAAGAVRVPAMKGADAVVRVGAQHAQYVFTLHGNPPPSGGAAAGYHLAPSPGVSRNGSVTHQAPTVPR